MLKRKKKRMVVHDDNEPNFTEDTPMTIPCMFCLTTGYPRGCGNILGPFEQPEDPQAPAFYIHKYCALYSLHVYEEKDVFEDSDDGYVTSRPLWPTPLALLICTRRYDLQTRKHPSHPAPAVLQVPPCTRPRANNAVAFVRGDRAARHRVQQAQRHGVFFGFDKQASKLSYPAIEGFVHEKPVAFAHLRPNILASSNPPVCWLTSRC
jgi:hypothetical protein